MKALVLEQYKQFQLASDYPEPEIGPHEVLIRVRSCGICGSDVHGFDGSSGRRVPPIIMGHEASGEIARVGSAVSKLAEGDRVTFDSMISCGQCFYCRKGTPNLCDSRQVLGVSCDEYRRHGAFAEYVSVPEHIVYKMPDGLSFDHAAMVEPVSVAVHAVNITPLSLGDTALVVGAGMIGLLTLQALRAAGAGKIVIADLADDRLELAKTLGADIALNPKNDDVASALRDLTDGRGADVAMEAVGATPTVKACIDSVRKGGAVTLIGNIAKTVEFGLQPVVTREISVFGSCASANDYPACLELLARGAIQVDPMISAKGSLDEGPSFFDRLYSHEPNLTKVILNP